MTPQPLTLANKVGNGTPAMADLIDVQEYLDGRLTEQSRDMGRRFVQVNKRLSTVCADVDNLKLKAHTDAAVAEALKDVATKNGLALHWRITVAIAVGVPAVVQLLPFIRAALGMRP